MVGGLIGGAGAKKAARRQAEAIRRASERQYALLRELAEPLLQEQRFALPKMRNLVMSQYAPQVGKDNPFLKAGHGMNLTNIGRDRERALANTMRYWQSSGNLGRSRGEQLRILRGSTEAANKENLSYGMQQQAFRDASADKYLNALNLLQGIGASGMQPMMSAINAQSQGAMGAANARAAGDTAFSQALGGGVSSLGSQLRSNPDVVHKDPAAEQGIDSWESWEDEEYSYMRDPKTGRIYKAYKPV